MQAFDQSFHQPVVGCGDRSTAQYKIIEEKTAIDNLTASLESLPEFLQELPIDALDTLDAVDVRSVEAMARAASNQFSTLARYCDALLRKREYVSAGMESHKDAISIGNHMQTLKSSLVDPVAILTLGTNPR